MAYRELKILFKLANLGDGIVTMAGRNGNNDYLTIDSETITVIKNCMICTITDQIICQKT